jgi:hypothetical protein
MQNAEYRMRNFDEKGGNGAGLWVYDWKTSKTVEKFGKMYGNGQNLYRNRQKMYGNSWKNSKILDATKPLSHEEKLTTNSHKWTQIF